MRINTRCEISAPNLSFRDRSDKLTIGARYTEIEADKGVVIVIHGLDICKDDPRLASTERAYQRMNYSTFAIDMRSNGSSEDGGQFHGFGSLRSNDILGAFDWLTARGVAANRITLHGQSLGGSAALFAGLREPRISRVIAKDPILNFDQIVVDGGTPDWFLPIFKITADCRI